MTYWRKNTKATALRFFVAMMILAIGSANAKTIVSVMVDDLDVTSYEQMLEAGLLPNIELYLVGNGASFSRSVVTNPLCCPSRSTYLTGQYTHNTSVGTNWWLVLDSENLPHVVGGAAALDDSRTIATALSAEGWRTAYIGKYLNGYGSTPALADSAPVLDPSYVPPGWDEWRSTVAESAYCMYDYTINANGALVKFGTAPEDYQTDVLADYAVEIIDTTPADTPLFLSVTPLAPHSELGRCGQSDPSNCGGHLPGLFVRSAPRHASADVPHLLRGMAYDEDVIDKPDMLYRDALKPIEHCYLAAIDRERKRAMLAVDDLVGRIVDALYRSGRSSETVFFFTSDNGFLLGQHRRTGKVVPYPAAYKVPLVIAPAAIRTSSALVANNDLVPTWLDIAGVSGLAPDGFSLSPLLNGAVDKVRERVLIEHQAAIPRNAPVDKIIRSDPTYTAVLEAAGVFYVEWTNDTVFGFETGDLVGIEEYDLSLDPEQVSSSLYCGSYGPACVDVSGSQRSALASALRDCAGETCRDLETNEMIP